VPCYPVQNHLGKGISEYTRHGHKAGQSVPDPAPVARDVQRIRWHGLHGRLDRV